MSQRKGFENFEIIVHFHTPGSWSSRIKKNLQEKLVMLRLNKKNRTYIHIYCMTTFQCLSSRRRGRAKVSIRLTDQYIVCQNLI
jgi:hypothetical protein